MYQTNEMTMDGTTRDEPLRLARCLGWFSVALGAAYVLAPHRFARALGMEGREGLIQGYGARDIATGLALLATGNPTPWIWGRVAGDALNIATLVSRLDENNPKRRNVEVALAAVAGVTAIDVICGQQLARTPNGTVQHYFADRSGFSRSPDAMRGAVDFVTPRDMQSPLDYAPTA